MKELYPYFSKNSVALLLCVDKKYFPAASVTIQSIIDHSTNNRNYDIIFFSSDCCRSDTDAIKDQIAGRDNFSIRFFDPSPIVEKFDMSTWFFAKRFSQAVYYRLFTPVILRNFSKILYLDSDLVVQTDIAELFDVDVSGYWLAAVPEFTFKYLRQWAEHGDWMSDVIQYCDSTLGLKDEKKYFNSGVLVYNLDKLREDDAFSKFIEFAPKNHKFNHDQNVLNATAQGKTLLLDREWNVNIGIMNSPRYNKFAETTEYQKSVNYAKILHYASAHKPWKDINFAKSYRWWQVAQRSPYYLILLSAALNKTNKHRENALQKWYKSFQKKYVTYERCFFKFFLSEKEHAAYFTERKLFLRNTQNIFLKAYYWVLTKLT